MGVYHGVQSVTVHKCFIVSTMVPLVKCNPMIFWFTMILPVSSRTYQLPSQWWRWLLPWFWTSFSAARWSSFFDKSSKKKQNICLSWAWFSPPAPVALLCDSSPRPNHQLTSLWWCSNIGLFKNPLYPRTIKWPILWWFVYNEPSKWRVQVQPKYSELWSIGQVLDGKENTPGKEQWIQARNYTNYLHVSDGIYQPKWCSRGHMDGIGISYTKFKTLM